MANSVWVGVDDEPTLAPIFDGQASFADGTAAAPSITFASAPTKGWYLANATSLGFSGHLLAGTDNTYDIGASGANRPRDVHVGTHVYAGTSLRTAGYIHIASAAHIFATTDGVVTLYNNAQTDFSRLQLGGTTSSFPAWKRNGAGFDARVADDTAYAVVTGLGLLAAGPTTGIGYITGAGGAVTQITSKATGVTLNAVTGNITMEAGSLAADTAVSFTLTDSAIAATDLVVVTHHSGGTAGAYTVVGQAAAGSAVITLRNVTAGALAEAVVLKFAVIKGATA